MNQAIFYMNKDAIDKNSVDKNLIPEQAITIPVVENLNKQTLLTSLAKACDFPSYFSHNWDSAWDCLTDSEITQLKLDLTRVKNINTEDFTIFKSIIEDAYRDFGKPQLWIVVSSKDK